VKVHKERHKGIRAYNPLMDNGFALQTESPIEKSLCDALNGLLLQHKLSGVTLKLQEPVGNYRADMMLVKQTLRGTFKLAIEADGRDWHSTEKQVARDKKRDRFFAARGICVMRFTGSEIHKSADECAAEAFQWVACHEH